MPRDGVQATAHGDAYGDRRLRDVSRVDYSSPGFAVVFAEQGPLPRDGAELVIRATRIATSLEPEAVAAGAAGSLVIRNETSKRHILSYPAAGLVRPLLPNERVEIPIARAGEQRIFLLSAADAATTLFASPGPYSRVGADGRFTLDDLVPGTHRVHAWHPRFPPTSESVELAPDTVLRLDFELGVGRSEPHAHGH